MFLTNYTTPDQKGMGFRKTCNQIFVSSGLWIGDSTSSLVFVPLNVGIGFSRSTASFFLFIGSILMESKGSQITIQCIKPSLFRSTFDCFPSVRIAWPYYRRRFLAVCSQLVQPYIDRECPYFWSDHDELRHAFHCLDRRTVLRTVDAVHHWQITSIRNTSEGRCHWQW